MFKETFWEKGRQKQTKQQNDIIKDEIDLTKAIKIVYNIKRPNSWKNKANPFP